MAFAKAVAEGMAVQALALELGWNLGLIVHVDCAASKAVASRSGVGRARCLEVKTLWVQAAVREAALC